MLNVILSLFLIVVFRGQLDFRLIALAVFFLNDFPHTLAEALTSLTDYDNTMSSFQRMMQLKKALKEDVLTREGRHIVDFKNGPGSITFNRVFLLKTKVDEESEAQSEVASRSEELS